MSAAVCARCGVPATKRVRWFVAGRDMPMFDVCEEHVEAERRAADALNQGRVVYWFRPLPARVRVTDLPEQLALPGQLFLERGLCGGATFAALKLYRSCRERDMLPWEALDYVQAELERVMREAGALGYSGRELSAQIAWVQLREHWRPTVERWRAAGAASEDRVSRLLGARR